MEALDSRTQTTFFLLLSYLKMICKLNSVYFSEGASTLQWKKIAGVKTQNAKRLVEGLFAGVMGQDDSILVVK